MYVFHSLRHLMLTLMSDPNRSVALLLLSDPYLLWNYKLPEEAVQRLCEDLVDFIFVVFLPFRLHLSYNPTE